MNPAIWVTTADQVPNVLLFGDLLCHVTGNDEPKFGNMRFDSDERDLIVISHAGVLYALIKWIQMFRKRVVTEWHICAKSKGLKTNKTG